MPFLQPCTVNFVDIHVGATHRHPSQVTTLCLSVGVWWWLGYAFFTAMHNHTWWPYMWKPHTCIVFVCGIHTCQFRIITSIMVTIIIIIITTTMAIIIIVIIVVVIIIRT